jgi:hypothetical protein
MQAVGRERSADNPSRIRRISRQRYRGTANDNPRRKMIGLGAAFSLALHALPKVLSAKPAKLIIRNQ